MTKFYQPVNNDHTVRIPLMGQYFNRAPSAITTTGSAIADVAVADIAVADSTGNTNSTKDQRFINCVFEKVANPYTKKDRFFVSKRPGWAQYNSAKLKSGHVGNAVHVWSSKSSGTSVVSAFGNTNSEIFINTTSIGSITGQVVGITETLIGTTPYLLFSSTDSTGWYYPDGGALTKIADADFPGNAGKTTVGAFVCLDGYTFILDSTGNIWNSDINSVTSWTSTNYIQAQMYPDAGVGLSRYKNQIVAFGRDTMEFFYDAGNPTGSPLASSPQGFIKLGCINAYAFTTYNDTLYWVSNSDKSTIVVYRLNGFTPEQVSTPNVEKILVASTLANIYLSGANVLGKSVLIVSNSQNVFSYDIDDAFWSEWQSGNGAKIWDSMSSTTGTSSVIYSVSFSDTQGYMYFMNNQSLQYADSGNAFLMSIQTSRVDGDSANRKMLSRLTIIADTAANSTVNVSWTDDDYTTWSTARSVSLAVANPYITNCGQFRRRAFRLENTDIYPVRFETMELQLKGGIH